MLTILLIQAPVVLQEEVEGAEEEEQSVQEVMALQQRQQSLQKIYLNQMIEYGKISVQKITKQKYYTRNILG